MRHVRLLTMLGLTGTALLGGGCIDLRVPDPAVVYIAFGDSASSGSASDDYPGQLLTRLGEPPETLAREGEGGETSDEGLTRLQRLLVNGIYPGAEVLMYWEGGNDIKEFIEQHDRLLLYSPDDPDYPFDEELERHLDATQMDIEAAIAEGRDAGLQVYVATYFFLMEELSDCPALPLDLVLPTQARRANAYLTRLNERIRTAANRGGGILVDVAAEDADLRGSPQNYVNCNHLSAEGNSIVADLFFQAFRIWRN